MFQPVLKEVVSQTEGGLASLVMDLDGIELDHYAVPNARFDIQTVGIELGVVLKAVQQAIQMLDAGETEEIAISSDSLTTVVRMVTENYFIAVALKPGGNIGKARYLLRTRVPELAEELV